MPRVITGRFRGTVLAAPKGDSTRPTTDKVKEALFSMIQADLYDAEVLDIFSGTGQIGIEALSRGARSVVMVDKAAPAVSVIRKNLEKVRIEKDDPSVKVLKMSAVQALEELGRDGRKFDLIFMDPPYKIAQEQASRVSELIERFDLLKDGGKFIVEHSSDEPFNTDVISLQFVRSCSYGLCVVTFFNKSL